MLWLVLGAYTMWLFLPPVPEPLSLTLGLAVAGAGVWLVYRRGAAAAAGRAASSVGS